MPDFTVKLTDRESVMMQHIASKKGKTTAEYLQDMVSKFVEGQIRGVYKKEFYLRDTDQLALMFGDVTATLLEDQSVREMVRRSR